MIAPDVDFATPFPRNSDTPEPKKPLRGKRVVVTRAAHQAGEVVDLLRARGAQPLLYPCIAIVPPEDTCVLDDALLAAVRGQFDWLTLTSVNTVRIMAERLSALGLDSSTLAHLTIAAVGPTTAAAVQTRFGLTVTTLPEEFRAEALARTIDPMPGTRILLPQADVASPELAGALEARGARVQVVTAYRTVVGSGGVDVPGLLARGEIDAVTFASPSAVQNFIWRLVEEGGSTQGLSAIPIACLGPATLKTARDCCLSGAFMPPVYTLEHLIQSLEEHFA